MDETDRAIIERITVRYDRPVEIPGGHKIKVFYDTRLLSPNDLARLAAQATGHLDHDTFNIALGVAYNGIFFASAVAGGRQVAIVQTDVKVCGPDLNGQKVVIVTDVVCSGGQIRELEQAAEKLGAIIVGYACIVDRSGGKVGSLERPLWSAWEAALS